MPKGETAQYALLAFSPFVKMFSKVVCCRGDRKRLYVETDYIYKHPIVKVLVQAK